MVRAAGGFVATQAAVIPRQTTGSLQECFGDRHAHDVGPISCELLSRHP